MGEPRDIGLDCFTAGVALGAADTPGHREVVVNDGQGQAPAVQQCLPADQGAWALATSLPTAPLPHAVMLADFNGDGRPDIVLAGSLLLAAAEPAAGPMGPAAAGVRPTRVPGLVRHIAEALRAFELRAPGLR